MPLGDVAAVVTHQQERAAGRNGARGGLEDRCPLRVGNLEIEDDHQLERVRLRLVTEQICGDPLGMHTACCGELPGLLEPDGREIDAGRLPSLLRQPDGVPALAAGQVKRSAGCQTVELLDQNRLASLVQMSSRPDYRSQPSLSIFARQEVAEFVEERGEQVGGVGLQRFAVVVPVAASPQTSSRSAASVSST